MNNNNKCCYVFLTYALAGYSGGPMYVRQKSKWLEKSNWEVIAFDCLEKNIKNEILIPELKRWSNNRFVELAYPPSWIKKRKFNDVLRAIVKEIPLDCDKIVVESNTIVLSLWGELLAETIGAKHLVLLISENAVIRSANLFAYYNFKYDRNEIFSISNKAFQSLFKEYKTINDADNRYFNAGNKNDVENVKCEEIESVTSDIVIGHFGRYKNYVPAMLQSINVFALKNSTQKITLLCLGIEQLPRNAYSLLVAPNIEVCCLPPKLVIPKVFFEKCDVVIATAACAKIAYYEQVPVISMDVENNCPLGILGFTTNQISYRSTDISSSATNMVELLSDIILTKNYLKLAKIDLPPVSRDYEYQNNIAKKEYIKDYYDVRNISLVETFRDKIHRILVNNNLFNFIPLIRRFYRLLK